MYPTGNEFDEIPQWCACGCHIWNMWGKVVDQQRTPALSIGVGISLMALIFVGSCFIPS